MEAPEKIYLQEPTKVRTKKVYDNDIEYILKDAFIKKVEEYLSKHQCEYIDFDDFKKYLED